MGMQSKKYIICDINNLMGVGDSSSKGFLYAIVSYQAKIDYYN